MQASVVVMWPHAFVPSEIGIDPLASPSANPNNPIISDYLLIGALKIHS